MVASTIPAPNSTVTIIPAGTYQPARHDWPQRNVPNNIRAWRIKLDIASRTPDVGVRAMFRMSWDAGVQWDEFAFALSPGDGNTPDGVLFVAAGLGGLASGGGIRVAEPGILRVAEGFIEVTNAPLITNGMTLELWT